MVRVLELARDLPCTAEQAWRLMTDPDEMNRWSSAKIVGNDPGVDDRFDRAGALRTVITPAPIRSVLREVVVAAEQPEVFAYRVYAGPATVRHHNGRIEIAETATGCAVRWTVEMAFVVPGLGALVERGLRRELGASLQKLADESLTPPVAASNPVADRGCRDLVDLQSLRATAISTLAEQQSIAAELRDDEDPKQWFARVYAIVTEEMIGLVDRGDLQHPDWALRLIPDFHVHYLRNLQGYMRGEEVEEPWQAAWSRCEQTDPRHPIMPIISGMLAGVRAHIECDLPRSIADVYLEHYRITHHYKDFRSDYLAMATVFGIASDRLLEQMPQEYKPLWVRASVRLPAEVRSALLNKRTFDIPRHRLAAFSRGYDIVLQAPENTGETADSIRE
ncbi:SRPBCC family protein [Gordonia rubripertincta]|uniref:DUF5995 family protein n=1 Tax=Gordonia rubripertincta TaxID=36822 RepID=A0ABT4N084_GORRU|nr:SRPBCC family protein [Gordonia rubripertincta]MCZ4552662.1 DUF5995 family protein [Gordonia rubripertincta]